MQRPAGSVWLGLLLAAAGFASEAGMPCVSCHPGQAKLQPLTSMARALQLAGTNQTLVAHPKLSVQKGRFRYAIETQDGHSIYSVSDGASRLTTPIEWTFGVDSQTYVYTRGGKLYESLVSFYPGANGLDTTMGDERLKPATVEDALGRELSGHEAKTCFGCHTTGAVRDGELQLANFKPGVQCEHCHTGASAHAAAIAKGKLDGVPAKLGKLSSEDLSNFCGQCHRSWETVVRNRWLGPINVRFQPYRLANSKCFDGTDARISCVACHDPHVQVVRSDASYDSKCLACHGVTKVCRVAKANCVSCHMPKVSLPGGHQVFTDHEIRVVRAGEAYPN